MKPENLLTMLYILELSIKKIIKILEEEAEEAKNTKEDKEIDTVIVFDNSSVYRSHDVK